MCVLYGMVGGQFTCWCVVVCSDRKNEIITEMKDELEQVRGTVHKLQQEVWWCVHLCLCVCASVHVCVRTRFIG